MDIRGGINAIGLVAHASNVTLRSRTAANDSAVVFYDSAGVCSAGNCNGTHFVITGVC